MVKDNTEQSEHPSALMHSKEAENTCQNPVALRKLKRPQIVKESYIHLNLLLKAYVARFNLIFIWFVYSSQVEAVCLLFKRKKKHSQD